MVGTLTSYQNLSRDIPSAISRVAAQPFEAREVEYFSKTIQTIKTVEDFVSDRRVFAFAMQAFGLGDMTYATAFMEKVLNEGISDDDSFANSLSDPRYREFAKAFNFESFGSAATSFDRAQVEVVDKYLRQTLEESQDNEGVRLALYFERKAPNITSYLQILAEPAIATVVRTALGIPQSTAALDLDKQVEMISGKLDLEEFQSAEGIEKFLQKFTALYDINNPQTTDAGGVGLLFGQAGAIGIDMNTMLQIQQLRRT